MERTEGIEPSTKPWQGFILPLNYIRMVADIRFMTPKLSGKSLSALERVGGIEPPFPAWKARVLTIIRHPRIGGARRIRTATVRILSPLSLPLEYRPIYKTLYLDSLRLPVPPFPYIWQGNQDSNLEVN